VNGLKLTVHFGERSRIDGAFVADALCELYARHALASSVILRGAEGFGLKHHLRTDRQLTLSEDLPMVAVAVDRRERVEPVIAAVERLPFDGLVTVERAAIGEPATVHAGAKLTVYVGRQERAAGRPAYVAVVNLLARRGIAGATVLLGVDGTAHGTRQRARFFARNAQVPLMIVSVGDGARIAAALPELTALLARPLLTVERVVVHKRDGEWLTRAVLAPAGERPGLGVWQKLTVYGGPRHQELMRALRLAGAAGATSLRGIWGFHGDHAPHGDSFWQLQRRVPLVTAVIDRPERARQWLEIVDAHTREAGLVTSELVPAFRAVAPGVRHGGLRLARPFG
jgi:PII-like signaling protein